MNKQTYTEIRQQLNFSPNSLELIGHLAQDAALATVIAALLLDASAWAYVFAQLLMAGLYFRAFGMMHDAVHRTLSKNSRINDGLGVFYGGLCFLPFTTWRSMHLDHHAWVGNFDKDPVMKMVRQFPMKTDFHQRADTLLWRSWIPYIAFLQEAVFWTVSAKLVLDKKSYEGEKIELVASVAAPLFVAAVILALGRALGSAFYFLPSVVVYLTMVEIINLPHHLCLPRLSGESKLPLWNQYKVSRTCVYASWFSRLVLLNFNFHAEHHMFPNLPWHELPKAHALVKNSPPEGYQFCEGHEWIRTNRQRDLKEVFAPTEALPLAADSGETKAA